MAIKFSQLPKASSIQANTLVPVVTLGITSNVLQVATGDTLSSYIYTTIAGNIATINSTITDLYSNASAQNTTLNTLTSGQSSQGSAISTLQSQVSTLQSNAATQDTQITAMQATILGGVVNTLGVTAPLAKSGTSTNPNISIPLATTSISGYLSNTDWNTFNNKAPTANPTFTGTTTTQTVVPSANVTYNLGSTTAWWNIIYGKAVQAQYADLAEMYLADAEYEVGTVLMVGGEKEVTACQFGHRAVGPVSANPSYLMNSELANGTIVALKGRVPVKVVGTVKKGQNLIAGDNGCATVAVYHSSEVFAIALESSDNSGEKLIEAVIL